MLTFFRRIIFTPIGAVIALAFIGLMGLAFALSDSNGLKGSALGGQATDTAVTIGNQTLTSADIANSIQVEFNNLKNDPRNQKLTMADFVAQGAFDAVIERDINVAAMAQFAQSQGMRVGRALVDNEIVASIPDIRGLDGKVDTKAYQLMLSRLRLTDAQLHDRFAGVLLAQMLRWPVTPQALGPVSGPATMAAPYASILLEHRTGTIAFIDTKKMPAGAPVTDAEAQAYYKANIARYTVPARRSVRYIALSMDDMRKQAAPSDDDVAKAFQAQAARFAAREDRALKQVVLGDQKTATDLAAKVRGGTAIDTAAKALGLEAADIKDIDKAKYAASASSALADQVFAAPVNGVVGPVKTPLGWLVVRVEQIVKVPAKTLAEAKPDLVKALTDQKLPQLVQDLNDRTQDAITKGQTLDQIAAMLKLPVVAAPPAGPDGRDPEAAKPVDPDPKFAAIYQLAFQTEEGDDPQVIPFGQDGSAAVAKLDKVIAAAPRPFASVADQIRKDITVERQLKAARVVANTILGKVNKGAPLGQALAQAGMPLDAPKSFAGTRGQIMNPNQPPPSQLILLFKTPLKTARLLEAPYKGGWFVIVVDTVTPGDASKDAAAIAGQRSNLGQWAPNEYTEQYIRAVRAAIGVKRNEAAIARVRAQLLGKSTGDDQQ